ncbi:hypothetical protein CPH39_24960 (plasmid) [Escherichia coli]|nr:hypothetical protein CPH39_24960 [Escherichia coli]
MALRRVLPGWIQDDSYRIRRSSRAERGVRAHSPAWSERPTPGKLPRALSCSDPAAYRIPVRLSPFGKRGAFS